jgi:preprotein translocase subunit SecG
MTTFILIFFVLLPNNTQAGVRVGFNTQEACVVAAREVASKLKALNTGADVTWSCVQQ